MGTLGQIKTSRFASFKAIVRGHDLLSYRLTRFPLANHPRCLKHPHLRHFQ